MPKHYSGDKMKSGSSKGGKGGNWHETSSPGVKAMHGYPSASFKGAGANVKDSGLKDRSMGKMKGY